MGKVDKNPISALNSQKCPLKRFGQFCDALDGFWIGVLNLLLNAMKIDMERGARVYRMLNKYGS